MLLINRTVETVKNKVAITLAVFPIVKAVPNIPDSNHHEVHKYIPAKRAMVKIPSIVYKMFCVVVFSFIVVRFVRLGLLLAVFEPYLLFRLLVRG